MLEHGELPKLHCCHKCDNPKCVRVDHLFLGTQADNIADMVAKRRHGSVKRGTEWGDWERGEKCHLAKVTNDQVRVMRAEWAAGTATRDDFRKRYGLSLSSVCRILTNKTFVGV